MLSRFELQKKEAKRLKRLVARKTVHGGRRYNFSPPPSLPAPVDQPLAAMDGVRLSRQSAVGSVQDEPWREAQRRLGAFTPETSRRCALAPIVG